MAEPHNITDEEINALEAVNSSDEWNEVCAQIKARRGGAFPPDWWARVMQSGMAARIMKKFGGSAEIRVVALK